MHSEGLSRAFAALEKLSTRLDGWIDKHEAENRSVADTVTDFKGRFRGVWMAGGLVVALGSTLVALAWGQVNEKLTDNAKVWGDAKAERVAIEARLRNEHDRDIARLQQQMDRMNADLEQLHATKGAR